MSMANQAAAAPAIDTERPPESHREHMRSRLLEHGPDTVGDDELLEMLLFLSISRRETKSLAKTLIASLGNLGQVCQADPGALRMLGLGNASIGIIDIVREAARRLDLADGASRPLIGNEAALTAYLDIPARLRLPPHTAALLLNNQSQLLADLSFPTARPAAEIIKAISRRALELEASTLILVSLRSDGQPVAMERDYDLGRQAARLSTALSMVFRNHFMFSADGHVSSLHLGVI